MIELPFPSAEQPPAATATFMALFFEHQLSAVAVVHPTANDGAVDVFASVSVALAKAVPDCLMLLEETDLLEAGGSFCVMKYS